MDDKDKEIALEGFEILSGIEFEANHRATIKEQLKENRDAYDQLRQTPIYNDVAPAFVFKPANARPPVLRQKQIELSEIQVNLPGSNQALAYLSLVELAHLIRTRQLSPVELTRLYLDRLTSLGKELHCVV